MRIAVGFLMTKILFNSLISSKAGIETAIKREITLVVSFRILNVMFTPVSAQKNSPGGEKIGGCAGSLV